MEEVLSHDTSTPLITQDIAQGRSIADNRLSIIKARISART